MSQPETKRRAKVFLDPNLLHAMLDLPAGVRVVGVQADFDPIRIVIMLEGEEIPESYVNAESPVGRIEPDRIDLSDEDVRAAIDADMERLPERGVYYRLQVLLPAQGEMLL